MLAVTDTGVGIDVATRARFSTAGLAPESLGSRTRRRAPDGRTVGGLHVDGRPCRMASSCCAELDRATLAEAFRGELVPQARTTTRADMPGLVV
jgi:hypothetical protein